MTTNLIVYENALFEHIKKVKYINELLIKKFELREIPYRVSGKAFPKVGEIQDEHGNTIFYHFHGISGTFYEEKLEIDFSIDLTSKYQIVISTGGFYLFLSGYLEGFNVEYSLIKTRMEELEEAGVFIKRKITERGVFHVNDSWFEAKLKGLQFDGKNKHDTDWL
jgi:hypothetical protein